MQTSNPQVFVLYFYIVNTIGLSYKLLRHEQVFKKMICLSFTVIHTNLCKLSSLKEFFARMLWKIGRIIFIWGGNFNTMYFP